MRKLSSVDAALLAKHEAKFSPGFAEPNAPKGEVIIANWNTIDLVSLKSKLESQGFHCEFEDCNSLCHECSRAVDTYSEKLFAKVDLDKGSFLCLDCAGK